MQFVLCEVRTECLDMRRLFLCSYITPGARVHARTSPSEICGGQRGTGAGFSPRAPWCNVPIVTRPSCAFISGGTDTCLWPPYLQHNY